MAKEVTNPPTGLKITRTGNKFTASWKIGDKDYGDSQHFQYIINDTGEDSWVPKKKTEIGHKATSKVITTINKADYYPNVDKKGNNKPCLYTIGFRVKGNRKSYTTGSGKKKKTHKPSPSAWAKKEFTVEIPRIPSVLAELDEELTNVCKFTWSAPYYDDDTHIFTDVQWQTILVKNSAETDGSKLNWKNATEGSGGAESSKTITEDTEILYKNGDSYVRWFRVRSRGPRGYTEWRYAYHVYALSHQANVTGTSASETDEGGFQCVVDWTVAGNRQNPIDKTTAQYTITIPDEGLTCPSGVSWSDANISRDTGEGDAAVFSIDDQLSKDQCLFIRVNTQHDSNITYGKPQLSAVGFLKDPSGLSVSTDNVTHKATISATNNSDVEDSILVVRYVPSSGDPIDIGVIPHNSSSVTVQCPNWDDQEAIAFDVYAMVGTATKQDREDGVDSYSIDAKMRSQNTITQGGAVPVAPQNVAVNRVEGKPDTVRVDWDWPWNEAGSAEISWSDHDDAWESTDEPESFLISNLHASHWNISGLETGKTWYVRVRLIAGNMTDSEAVTYGPWSDISQGMIDLSSAPNKPVLILSNSVIPEDGSTTASWVYTTTDNTAQSYAEVAIVDNGEYTPIAHSLTAQHVTIPAKSENYSLSTGNIYNLVCRVKSASGKLSEWSDIVSLTVAEPITCEIAQTSLVQDRIETNPREFGPDDSLSFETELEEDYTKLQVDLEPIQENTPWIGTEKNTAPYTFRAMPDQSNDYNRESLNQIVGATVGWNQKLEGARETSTANTLTYTNLDTFKVRITGTGTGSASRISKQTYVGFTANHKYFVSWGAIFPSGTVITLGNAKLDGYVTADDRTCGVVNCARDSTLYLGVIIPSGTSVDVTVTLCCVDLTSAFKTFIADKAYTLEQSTPGSGIAWLRSYGFLTKDYYEYCQPRLESVRVSGHVMRDADDNIIGNYPLDSTLTLNGILKLSGDEIYADGDVYGYDGGVSRRYAIVDLGTLYWNYDSSYEVFSAGISGIKTNAYTSDNLKCVKYPTTPLPLSQFTYGIRYTGGAASIMIKDPSYTDAATFKTAMSGVYLVYELATPTTETAAPYTQIQICDPDGTEAFVDYGIESGDRDVAIPAGHESTYSLVCPIYGHDDVTVEMRGKNLWHTDFTNSGGGLIKRDGEMEVDISAQTNTTYLLGGSSAFIGYKLKAGTYTLSAQSNDFTGIYVTLSDGTTWVNGATKTFATEVTINNVRCWEKVLAVGTYTLQWRLQIELGSTATAYEPYTSRTITETIVVSNVWDEEVESGYLGVNGTNIAYIANTNRIRSKNWIPVMPNTTYYYKSGGAGALVIGSEDTVGDKCAAIFTVDTLADGKTFTTGANTHYIKFAPRASYGATYKNDIAIYYPPFADGQVYGGTVDLVSGELVVDRAYVGGSSWVQYSANNGYKAYRLGAVLAISYDAQIAGAMSNVISEFGSFSSSSMNKNIIQTPTSTSDTAYMALQENMDASNVYLTYRVKTPQTYQLTPQQLETLKGPNKIESENGQVEIRIVESVWEANVLKEMPLAITVTGAGDGGITTIMVERAEDYPMERPDETSFHGNKGEIVLQTSPPLIGTNQVSFDVKDLIGPMDDGAAYNIVATVQDGLGQTDDAILPFEVHWAHQAEEPSAEIEIDEENLIALITPIAPENADPEDVADIYRLSADRPELIVEGAEFGETYVDPYPALGDMGGHRIVTRTKNGDYITEDNQIAMIDSPELGVNPIENEDLLNIIDFEGRQIQFYWETDYSNTWAKDFQETQYLGGSIEGDWNPAVSRSGTLSSKAITVLDQEMLKDVRRLADYPGICHVRTADGSSYAADVQVSEDYTDDEKGMVTNYSLSITKVDPQGFEGMTKDQWDEENPPEEEEEP